MRRHEQPSTAVAPPHPLNAEVVTACSAVSSRARATLEGMMRRKLLRRRRCMAASALLIAAVSLATGLARPAAGESPAGTRITHVSVEQRDGDSTVIAVSFDGPITGHRWSHIDGDKPRGVVKISGIVEAYRPYEVAVEDGRVHRVRIGHHPEFNPPEEHLVFDLVDARVVMTRVFKQDRRLMVVLQRAESSIGQRLPAPTAPTPTALVPKTAPATPTPTMTPTTTATPSPTATATGTPTSAPARPRAAAPTVPTGPEQVAAADRRAATTPPPDFSGPLLTELVISHREDGSALVRVTADRPIERSDVRFFSVRDAPPRNLLVLPGTGLRGEDARLPVLDGLLCEIGLAFTQEGGSARTELTFYLASSEVAFEQAAVKGLHAVIHLRPPADPETPLSCEVESRMRSRSWRFIATGPPQEAPIGDE